MKKISLLCQLLFFSSAISLLVSCRPTVEMYQPNIKNGGRTMSLTTHPSNNSIIFASTETGGLFKTEDEGISWKHIDSLHQFALNDVKFAPSDPNIIIVTAFADTRTTNGGGIWRSTDGGETWTKPTTGTPPASSRCTDRFSAFGISFEPNSNNVYVGTDYGIAFSNDLGSTWTHQIPEPTLLINEEKTQDRIYSVLARGNNKVNALGMNGVYYTDNGGTNWTKCSSPGGDNWVIHGLAQSPKNSDHLFLSLYCNQAFLSTDGGHNWNNITINASCNRPSFIKTSASVSGNANQFDFYYGNGSSLYRKTITDGNPPDLTGAWQSLSVDHADPSDIAFDNTNRNPILLASDGGVHKTTDNGAHWTLAGGGEKGLNALQITEVNGQVVEIPNQHVDLYFGTQDNDLWASSDKGVTWLNPVCCEGFFIGTDKYNSNETNSKVSFVSCAGCGNYYSNPHFINVAGWTNPFGNAVGNPFILSEGKYIQSSQLVGSTDNLINYTENTGTSWTPKANIPQGLRGTPQIAGSETSPVIYQGVTRSGLTPSGEPKEGLVRIDGINTSTPTIRNADGTGFGSLGIYPTMFAWYRVLGANPNKPDQVIIADISDDKMKYTSDGGLSWLVDSTLTNLVTDYGKFRFREGPFPQAHAIAFNPFNANDIFVGTNQNGIIRSTDGGAHWSKIEGSKQVTNISSFFFHTPSHIFVSTYGRGLWQLNVDEAPQITIPKPKPRKLAEPLIRDPRSGVMIPLKDLGDPDVCPVCTYVIISYGEIMDLDLSERGLTKITLDKGEVLFLDKDKNFIPSSLEIAYSTTQGNFSGNEFILKLAKSGQHIRGLRLEKNKITGIITADDDVTYLTNKKGVAQLKEDPKPNIKLVFPMGSLGQNAISRGEVLTLIGKGYNKATKPFKISIGDRVLDNVIKVNEKGEFKIDVPIDLIPGIYKVVIRSAEDNKIEKVDYINVVVNDFREKR